MEQFIMRTLLASAFFTMMYLFVSAMAHAETCDTIRATETKEISTAVPTQLQGAQISVFTTTGEVFHFNADEFKVVPRKKEVLVTKETITCEAKQSTKNHVAMLAGQGPTGHLKTTRSGQDAEVESGVGLVVGAQYTRQVTEVINLGVQLQSNKTTLGVFQVEF